jgi:hypothetical protein
LESAQNSAAMKSARKSVRMERVKGIWRRTQDLVARFLLKILPADLAASEDRMRRFVLEAKAAAALNHPKNVLFRERTHRPPNVPHGRNFVGPSKFVSPGGAITCL